MIRPVILSSPAKTATGLAIFSASAGEAASAAPSASIAMLGIPDCLRSFMRDSKGAAIGRRRVVTRDSGSEKAPGDLPAATGLAITGTTANPRLEMEASHGKPRTARQQGSPETQEGEGRQGR